MGEIRGNDRKFTTGSKRKNVRTRYFCVCTETYIYCAMRASYDPTSFNGVTTPSGIDSIIHTKPCNSGDAKIKSETRAIPPQESPLEKTRTRNRDKDWDLDGREREIKKRWKKWKAVRATKNEAGEERRRKGMRLQKGSENWRERRKRRPRRVLAGLKGGCEEREFPLSYIFFLIFSGVPWEKFVVWSSALPLSDH